MSKTLFSNHECVNDVTKKTIPASWKLTMTEGPCMIVTMITVSSCFLFFFFHNQVRHTSQETQRPPLVTEKEV